MPLLDLLFRWPAMQEQFSDSATIGAMLRFEAALAKAEANAGVIPKSAADAITAVCKPDQFALVSLQQAAAKSGNLAIPLVHQLSERVAVRDAAAARYVHWGATSQDASDTATVLQLRSALDLLESELGRLTNQLATLARKHRTTPITGRTWLQHALPTTFGFVVAGWLDALLRCESQLSTLRETSLALQFGGAVGTLAALGDKADAVSRHLADELNLALPDIPWHSLRDRFSVIGTTLGILAGTLGKIARDISLYTQTEVQEVFEPFEPGRGGSSSMPHKRNPVSCAAILASSIRVPSLVATILAAMPQEYQRGLGGWQAEWETLPEIVQLTAGSLHGLANIAPGLEVDTIRMRSNLEVSHGLIFAEAVSVSLAPTLGKQRAHELVEGASHRAKQSKIHLKDALLALGEVNAILSPQDLERLFDPTQYLGTATQSVDRVLARYESIASSRKA